MYRKYIKRILDLIFAVVLLPFAIFVILICGILVRLDDGGPIFYCGKRLGKNGRIFTMFKLRTMKVNSPDLRNPDGSTYNSDDDPRLTKVGRILRKTSLDEIPQIFNVIKGEMSFIGPRPDLPEHINCYEVSEKRKLEVLPGISGYNQAYFRNAVEWKERLKNDVYYVDNISFWLDCKIFLKTIQNILLRKGIYTNSYADNVKDVDGYGLHKQSF